MKTHTLVSAFCFGALIAAQAVPVNDTFEKATILTGRTPTLLAQNGSTATPNVLDPYLGTPIAVKPTHSVWYRYDALVTIASAQLIITDHTTVGIHAGVFRLSDPDGGAGSLVSVAQMTNTGGLDVDTLTFSLSQGDRYYIAIDAPGSFDLKLKTPSQANDYFEDATPLAGNDGTVQVSNGSASNDNDVPIPNPLPHLAGGIWFTWTPSFSGAAKVDTKFSENFGGQVHITSLAIFTGVALNGLTLVGSDEQSNATSLVSLTVTAGTTYRIWVGTNAQAFHSSLGSLTLSYYRASNPGIFALDLPSEVGEDQGNAKVQVRRYQAGTVTAGVTLSTGAPSFGTAATAGADYTAVTTTLSFAAGQQESSVINIPLLLDNVHEGVESFGVSLSAPSGGAVLGSPSSGDIAIVESTGLSNVFFKDSIVRVKESSGTIFLPVGRTNYGSAVRITYSMGDEGDTALPGVDYFVFGISQTLEPYDDPPSFGFSINNDGVFRGQRSFKVFVSSGDPGATLSSSVTIIIDDDDLVVPVAGRLSGLLDNGGIAGSYVINVSATGTVTGKVVMARGTFAFTGKLDASGYLRARLGTTATPLRTLELQLVTPQSYTVTLNDGDQGSLVSQTAKLTTFSALNLCPVAGKYTFHDNGDATVPLQIAGLMTVNTLGAAIVSGRLFDGTAIVASGAVDTSNAASLGVTLYAGKGRATLTSTLPTAPGILGFINFHLLRPGRANQTAELPSLDSFAGGSIARYVPPLVSQRILSTWSAGTGFADLTGAGFAGTVTKAITISTVNKVTVTTLLPEKLSVVLYPSTGLFVGSVIPTGALAAQSIYGFLVQGGATPDGGGFFRNGVALGKIKLRGP